MAGEVLAGRNEMSGIELKRPEYDAGHPNPQINEAMNAAAKRKTVWLHPENNQPFWLSHERALKALADQGGVIFPPDAEAA